MGGAEGQASDIKIQAEQILKIKDKINKILSENTGQDIKKVSVDTDRDYYLTAEDAKKYGIIDVVLK